MTSAAARSTPTARSPAPGTSTLHSPHPELLEAENGRRVHLGVTRGTGYTYKGPYWAPYRCLYSRNIDNLFMAGRDISVTREALGPVRVMRTCGMMGEIVGKAAWICHAHDCAPRATSTRSTWRSSRG